MTAATQTTTKTTTWEGRNVMDYKLEVVLLPVSDVDRAKSFYTEQLGFNLDVDHRAGEQFRVVQVTHQARRARSRSVSASATRRPARFAART
jgi:catechol 2,3-dioxygenase-like lactoylglutathione lyase family enzyme